MDATELFMQQCKQARVDADSILAFGRRKLKPAPQPKLSEFAQPLGRVVGQEEGAASPQVPKRVVVEEAAGKRPALDPATHHFVLGTPLALSGIPPAYEAAVFATGCFWGAEKGLWRLPGVYSTACVYASLPQEAPPGCIGSGDDRVEAVWVVFDPLRIAYADLLRWFWQCHDPAQADGQGNDIGYAYRSVVFVQSEEQRQLSELSRSAYQAVLAEAGHSAEMATRIEGSAALALAEPGHQQYLAKPGARPYCSARPLPVQLPEFRGGWGRGMPEALAPKLGRAFWREHGPQHSVLKAPDAQIRWSPADEDREYSGVAAAILGSEGLMVPKGHGNTETGPQGHLRWGCSGKLADEICCQNREGAERAGYFASSSLLKDAVPDAGGKTEVVFYDSVTGKALFVAPRGRTWEEFVAESRAHGWPSFRDEEVLTEHVRMLPGGETVSTAGTHLGHNLPDDHGNRYCINLVSVAGVQA